MSIKKEQNYDQQASFSVFVKKVISNNFFWFYCDCEKVYTGKNHRV